MTSDVVYVLAIVAVALIFDFINGVHDSANSIAFSFSGFIAIL